MASPAQIDGLSEVLDFTPVLDTSIYADGEVLWITQILRGAVRVNDVGSTIGARSWLTGVLVLDEDDQGAAFDLLFLDANVSIGTLNAAVSITDANARSIIGRASIGSGDFYDLGTCKLADVDFSPKLLKAMAPVGQPNRDLWLAGVSRGTGTYTASGLKLKLKVAYE